VDGAIVLFGGQDINAAALNDTWTWNGSEWSELNDLTVSPNGRFAAAAAVLQGKLVIFGGTTNQTNDFSDTWVFDGKQWYGGPTSGPTVRAWSAMAGPG
jgi:N-acetylneuraminic acid mutarotase